jgi:hypothetical protein
MKTEMSAPRTKGYDSRGSDQVENLFKYGPLYTAKPSEVSRRRIAEFAVADRIRGQRFWRQRL